MIFLILAIVTGVLALLVLIARRSVNAAVAIVAVYVTLVLSLIAIFLGARGIGRLKKFLLGSVSSSVAAKAKFSVEVIRIKDGD